MTDSETKQWQGFTGGGTLGQKALLFLFGFANVTVGYAFLALVVPFYMLFARQSYLSIYRYFRKHFFYSPLKAFCKTYQNHFIFGQCMLDRFAVYAGKKDFFDIEITGLDTFEQLLDKEKGFIIASSHVGNFELSGYLLKQDKKHINVLVFGGETKEVMKNRLKSFNPNNISVIPVFGDDIAHIFSVTEALSNGEVVSMPADRIFGSEKSVKCQFLSEKANFPVGAFALAAALEVNVAAVFCVKISTKKYKVFVKQIGSDVINETGKTTTAERKLQIKNLATEYVKELENIVKQYPEQWFNFYEFWK